MRRTSLAAMAMPLLLAVSPLHRASAPPVYTLTLTEYQIAGPASVPAGFSTFRAVNAGKELHQAQLLRLAAGKTPADLVAALKAGGPPPPWITWLGGPQSNGNETIALSPGDYVWICMIPDSTGTPHFAHGMIAPMKVTAMDAAHGVPRADINVTAQDYTWQFSQPVTAGTHTLRLQTAPGQPHEFVVVALPPGKTAKDVVAWAMHPSGKPPALSVQGIAALQPGVAVFTTVDFTPGHYAILCFVPDAKDGQPHAKHGMVSELTVQ